MTPDDAYPFREAMIECARAVQKRPPLDEADFQFYWKKLEDVSGPIVIAALDALSKEQNYFPAVAKIREKAAGIVLAQRAEAWQKAIAGCTHEHHWVDTGNGLERCPCWQNAIAAKNAVGAPLALPPPQRQLGDGNEEGTT